MSIKLYNLHMEIDLLSHTFGGGERHIRISPEHIRYIKGNDFAVIQANIKNSNDIMDLLLLNNSLKILGVKDICLILPYVPYGRQDRSVYEGEPLSLKVFADLINSCKFSSVKIIEPHSYVTTYALDNVEIVNIEPSQILKCIPKEQDQNIVFVSPDAGAEKRVSKIANYANAPCIVATKSRKDNKVEINFQTNIDVYKKDLWIIDDICDGGRTFIELAKAIRSKYQPRTINLFVYHGIFSNGLDELSKHLNSCFCLDTENIKIEYEELLISLKKVL